MVYRHEMSPSLRYINNSDTTANTTMAANTLTVFFFQNILSDSLID